MTGLPKDVALINTSSSVRAVVRGSNVLRPVHWDRSRALDRLGGDESLLKEAVKIALDEVPLLLQLLQGSLRSRNPVGVEGFSHSLKGALGCLGAGCAGTAASLERLARAGELQKVDELLIEFEAELSGLIDEMKRALV